MLDESLAGLQGVDALRRLTLDPLGHGVRRLLADQVPDWNGEDLRLIRTKYKPSRKVTATYVLPDGRHAAVVWSAEPVKMTVSPDDDAMPHLAGLHDPAHRTDLLGFAGRVETIRYRPAQRHVLRVTSSDHAGVHVKMDRDDSGAHAVPVAEALGTLLAHRCPEASVAEPVGYFSSDRTAVWRTAKGASLSTRLNGPDGERHVHLVGRAIRVLHDARPDDLPSTGAGARDAHAEIAATLRAGEHIRVLLPEVGIDYLALVDEIASELEHIPTEDPTFTHGDLKSDNVLASNDGVRLLDLDRCGPADPALDLAKFVADLRWWTGADEDRANTLIDAFRTGYGASDSPRWDRALSLTRLFQLKLAARRCAVHDPSWASDVRARVAAAAPVMAGGA